jgi:hypothetical protein
VGRRRRRKKKMGEKIKKRQREKKEGRQRTNLGIKAGGRSYINERMLIGEPASYERAICSDWAVKGKMREKSEKRGNKMRFLQKEMREKRKGKR